MTDHPNAKLVRGVYDAFGRGDVEAALARVSDGFKWHFPGRSPAAGDFEGHEAFLGSQAAMAEATGGGLSMEVVHVVADDAFAVAIEHVKVNNGDKQYDRHDIAVFRVKDGTIVEGWAYPENLYEWDEALS